MWNSRVTRALDQLCPAGLRGPLFPGVVAHHTPGGWVGPIFGHACAFNRFTVIEGHDPSSYFRESGISGLAERNEGICTFHMAGRPALYQIDNAPRAREEFLTPPTVANRGLFGDFMGTLAYDHVLRREKRSAVESTMGSSRFVRQLEPAIRHYAKQFFECTPRGAQPLDIFLRNLVAYVESLLPGVIDLYQRPLSDYLQSEEFGRVTRDFFERASAVISKANRKAVVDHEMIVPFVRTLLRDNFEALSGSQESNLIRRHFRLWKKPFSRETIASLSCLELKELGTLIVALYDTTYLSLLWVVAYVESHPAIKQRVVENATKSGPTASLDFIDLVVLEGVRLGGSNPTALSRRVMRPFIWKHRGRDLTMPAGVAIWLDRRQANQDPSVFPKPATFDPENISRIMRSERETFSSILSRARYEINSFSMINTERNPRKCPGRLFSVFLQSVLLRQLYGSYNVVTQGVDTAVKRYSSMPRPANAGTVRIVPIQKDHQP